ncbi:hypothetical protein BGX24_003504, partial [Mortierella sp. AD032]
MFYSKEILVQKDTQLGLIWLAATLGPRSGINKMSKKEVNGVNIVKSCKDISQPVEPFALRFSSNLMVGVTRLYSQQYNFYSSDVSNTWMRLKRDLAVVQSENLDMMNPGAKIDAITFGYDLTIEQDLFRPASIIKNYEIEVARNSQIKEVAVEFGWAPQSLLLDVGDISSGDQSPPSLFSLPVDDERRRRITLDERPGMAGADPRLNYEPLNAGLADDMFKGEDDELYVDAEGNARADMPDQSFAIGDDGSIFSGPPDTPATEGTLRTGGMLGTGGIVGKRAREESVMSGYLALKNNGLFDDILQETGDQDMVVGTEEDGAVWARRQRAGPRQRRPAALVSDNNTILSEEELKTFKHNYLQDQAVTIRSREAKEQLASVKTRIDNLGDFWITAGVRTLAKDRMVGRGDATDALHIEQPRNVEPISGRGTREHSWAGPGEGDQLFTDEASDLELGRRLTNSPSAGTPAGAN